LTPLCDHSHTPRSHLLSSHTCLCQAFAER
jgi:hypothetical protein